MVTQRAQPVRWRNSEHTAFTMPSSLGLAATAPTDSPSSASARDVTSPIATSLARASELWISTSAAAAPSNSRSAVEGEVKITTSYTSRRTSAAISATSRAATLR